MCNVFGGYDLLNIILAFLKMDETVFAFQVCPSKMLRKINLLLMDTKLNILIIYFTIYHYNNAACFYFMISS